MAGWHIGALGAVAAHAQEVALGPFFRQAFARVDEGRHVGAFGRWRRVVPVKGKVILSRHGQQAPHARLGRHL